MATTDTVSIVGINIQRIRISGSADLKEFNGREKDEDRARIWTSKSSLRAYAISSKVEKFLIFGDLLTGLAQNWHSQLRRTTCCSWKKPLERFIIQYGGYDMPAERQYHYARKRADETPFKYLYCLSVAAIRVKI